MQTSPLQQQQLKEYLEYQSRFCSDFFSWSQFLLASKKFIRVWICLVSALESSSLSRRKMFIKVPFFIFILGSVSLRALAEEGKKNLYLKVFADLLIKQFVCLLRWYRFSVLLIKLFLKTTTQQLLRFDQERDSRSFLLGYVPLERTFCASEQRKEQREQQRNVTLALLEVPLVSPHARLKAKSCNHHLGGDIFCCESHLIFPFRSLTSVLGG